MLFREKQIAMKTTSRISDRTLISAGAAPGQINRDGEPQPLMFTQLWHCLRLHERFGGKFMFFNFSPTPPKEEEGKKKVKTHKASGKEPESRKARKK